MNDTNIKSKSYHISLEPEYKEKWDIIGKKEHRKNSDLIRKWIDENWKEEFEDIKKEVDLIEWKRRIN